MTRLGVVGALEPEIRAFGVRSSHGRSGKGFTGAIMPAVCGVGAERAYRAGKRLVEEGATALVSWGTAVALDPRLRPGSLLLPDRIIADAGREFNVDAEWRQRVRARLPRELDVHAGALAETRRPLLSATQKASFAQSSGAAAADMESAALAALAHEAGVPLLVVRAIVDSAAQAVPARLAAATRADGSLCIASTLAWLVVTPAEWPTTLRLAFGFRAALRTLQRVAREVRD
jgi:hopanoid-associated phosphorylase